MSEMKTITMIATHLLTVGKKEKKMRILKVKNIGVGLLFKYNDRADMENAIYILQAYEKELRKIDDPDLPEVLSVQEWLLPYLT